MQKFETREAITLDNQGQKIFAVLHLPLNQPKAPVVVMCSGYGGNKCGKFRLAVRTSQELAKRGIASLRFDYRGTGDSEGDFERLTIESQVSDTLCCLNYLKSSSVIDAQRMALFGRSLGGMIAILATRNFTPIKSLILWSPVFHSTPWQKLWQSIQSNQILNQAEKEMAKSFSSSESNQELIKQFFQTDLTADLSNLASVPLLHIHGVNDQVVTQEHQQAYQKARLNHPHSRFIILPHSDHSFSHVEEQKIVIEETCQWCQQTL